MKLYNFELSGNCQKIRMMLSFLAIEYEKVNIDILKQDQMSRWFLELNSLHKVPVLDDEGLIIRDSSAILVYLARKYGKTDWYPDSPEAMANIQQWLSFSVNEVFHGLAISRAIIIFKRDMDLMVPHTIARVALQEMEQRLKDHDWLALDQFTLADIACYPYTALVHEANLSLEDYPSIRAWFKRIEAMPGFEAMRGLPYPG